MFVLNLIRDDLMKRSGREANRAQLKLSLAFK